MTIAIRIENVSKQYRLGEIGTGALAHDLNRWWHRLRGKEDPYLRIGEANDQSVKGRSDYVWALKDVSFDVKQGQAIGIIGRNGAGKSTILKILSRVTLPTNGYISAFGRIASLLEVGTGFHPELTGRENIFLNGAILGMRKHEISRKLDEIIDFSGCERYIDTPVKRYSSGMYVRLAFSVAAHLESEILVVDEVLAVGDIKFQQKCLGKMRDITGTGRTLLFVSHNLGSIRQLCNSSVLLDCGKIQMFGTTGEVLDTYLSLQNADTESKVRVFAEDESKPFQLIECYAGTKNEDITQGFRCDDDVFIYLKFKVRREIPGVYGYCQVMSPDGTIVMEVDSMDSGANPFDGLPVGEHRIVMKIPRRVLGHGDYRVHMAFASRTDESQDVPDLVATLHLDDETTWRGNRRGGLMSVITNWSIAECTILDKAQEKVDF